MRTIRTQGKWDVRCEWGEEGVRRLSPHVDVTIIVDVLSFSTSVNIAVESGAIVYPYRFGDESASSYATSLDAVLADPDQATGRMSLSPTSLLDIPRGTRLVLPSPDGATLSLLSESTWTLAGCLRNAQAVASASARLGKTFAVIMPGKPCPDGSLRPATEDLLGAGAIIRHLPGSRSSKSQSAASLFEVSKGELWARLHESRSGQDLADRDVDMAGALNASFIVPVMRGVCFKSLDQ